MKRFTVILFVLVLAAVLIPTFSIVARQAHTPHENPATAGDSSDVILMLLFHGDVFDLMLSGKYQDAQGLLNELQHANISSELQYVVDRFNALSQELLVALDNLEGLLNEASAALAKYQLKEARQMLEEAGIILWDIERLRVEIQQAGDALGNRLNITNVASTEQLRQIYDRLQGLVWRLHDLVAGFNQLWEALSTEYDVRVAEELLPTNLTLEVMPGSAFIGDNIFVTGRLTSGDAPLADRQVTVLRKDEPMVFTTDEDGSYAAAIGVPLDYVSSTFLETRYLPAGSDIGIYAASISQSVTIEIRYYDTFLEVAVPGLAYPGLPVTVSGRVSSTGDVVERTVSLLLDNVHLADVQTEDQFEFEVTIPQDTLVGAHGLNAVVAPYGRYAGTSKGLDVRVTEFQIEADIQAPSLFVTPGQVEVNGRVHIGPEAIAGASVVLTFGTSSSSIVETSADGSFTAVLDEPLRLSLAGPQKLTVGIEPGEPYYGALEVEKWIVVVNPVGISLVLVGLVSVGLLVYRRMTTRPVTLLPTMTARTPDLITEVFPVIPPPRPKPEISDIRGEIWAAYLEGVGVVEKATGTYLGPNATLREFLGAVVSQIAAAARQPMAELTTITEIALYSAREPDAGIVTDARQLASIIRKEVEGDAA
ncbi:MAG: hypothetical protein JSV77_07470 [Dehalococcoidales bacterium]|nr:MAG: hypothetical protein JSV77_07470 [Dehalococcoidales bacterium]